MNSELAAILATSAFQSILQITAIIMLYLQSRMLNNMNMMVSGANQLAAASVHMDDLVKEERELLRKVNPKLNGN